MLDLGCGDGAMLDHLQRTRLHCYGVEIDDAMCSLVKRVNVIQLNLTRAGHV